MPLAIVQAGTFIAKSQNIGSYLELYAKNQAQLLSEKPAVSNDCCLCSLYTTWQKSFDRLTPSAAMLLQHCSFLHYNGISEKIFSYASEYQFYPNGPSKGDLQEPLEFLSHFLGPTGDWDSLQFTHAMNEIQAYSLISFNKETKLFSVHPLVHAWGRVANSSAKRHMLTVVLYLA